MNNRTSLILLVLAFVAFTGLFTACNDMRCYREDYSFEYGNGCVSACREGEWLDVCPDGTHVNYCYYNKRTRFVKCTMDPNFRATDPKKCAECEELVDDYKNRDEFEICSEDGICSSHSYKWD